MVVAGMVDRRTDWRIAQMLKVAQVFRHPSFTERSALNDIALLKLATPANFSARVSPVHLPRAGDFVQPRTPCVVTGYGYPNPKVKRTSITLQQAPIPLLPLADCRRYWGPAITEDFICAGASGVGLSKGDSGGPLVCLKDGAWTLACILSRGTLYSLTYKPFVCHRITSLLPWIQETMANN
ncbi:chymotrypsinogen B-like [Talpa occidentalis]|uniref:chymotrypsinogen B-like n=1 Tax=Talpa occidentalis TaxID=50954 RepID=UPI00188EDCA3|nr:chymotrypsinogen B-like [Talpa occidentalis]